MCPASHAILAGIALLSIFLLMPLFRRTGPVTKCSAAVSAASLTGVPPGPSGGGTPLELAGEDARDTLSPALFRRRNAPKHGVLGMKRGPMSDIYSVTVAAFSTSCTGPEARRDGDFGFGPVIK